MSKEELIKAVVYKLYTTNDINRIKVFVSPNYPLFSAFGILSLYDTFKDVLYNPLIWIDSE